MSDCLVGTEWRRSLSAVSIGGDKGEGAEKMTVDLATAETSRKRSSLTLWHLTEGTPSLSDRYYQCFIGS